MANAIRHFAYLRTLTVAATALAIFAIAAVMLLSGGGPAQADTAALTPDGNGHLLPQQKKPTPTPPGPTQKPPPQQTEPEGCITPAASVISSGHYAVFEAYWDAEDKNLVNNPCPPAVTHNADETVTRLASGIDIGQTIMHVSGGSNLTPEPNSSDDYERWPFLYPDAGDADGNGIIEGSEIGEPYSTKVWALHDCSHDADPPPTEDDLCIGVSAGLLRADDWRHIDFEVESVRVEGIAPADRGEAFVFHPREEDAGQPVVATEVLWGTDDPTDTGIDIDPGEYLHPRWAFTQPGTYRFQVHVNGTPNPSFLRATSVTSEVRTYTVHVGDLSDVGVAISASDTAPDVGDQVTYTVTASNAGPDTAADAEVTVTLPAGLTYSSHSAATGTTYDSTTGVWTVGDLAVTNDDNSATLAITATVGSGTHGQPLIVTVTIKAYETIGTSTVVELDPREEDNSAEVTVTPVVATNVAPMFQITRSVPENSTTGAHVGDPVAVKEPDADDTLTFTLVGNGAVNFTTTSVAGGAQITVAEGAHLNYEHKQSYDLVLTVSDGKDVNGNANSAIDNSIALNISLEDVVEPVTATVGAAVSGGGVRWTFTVSNPPTGATNAVYRFSLRDTTTELLASAGAETRDSLSESFTHNDSFPYASGTYQVEGSIQYDVGGTTHYVHADISGDQIITIP